MLDLLGRGVEPFVVQRSGAFPRSLGAGK
jgi:hypothetical protein